MGPWETGVGGRAVGHTRQRPREDFWRYRMIIDSGEMLREGSGVGGEEHSFWKRPGLD